MTLTPNPTNTRLKYIWDKQKPQMHPVAMMDLLASLGIRLKIEWTERVEDAARRADPRLHHAFIKWRHGDDNNVDVPFVDAVMAAITTMPEFKKAHPVDGLVQWFAKEMDTSYRRGIDPADVSQDAAYRRFKKLRETLEEEPALIEWFEKKKPNLTKMDAGDLFEAVEKFEEDREPEVVYEWKDGWKIVKLMTRTQIQGEGARLDNCLREGSSYTEGYCKQAEKGTSEFFSLRNKAGESILSIQWSPNVKTPEQVYGQDNREPDNEEAKRVEEWAESRGGTYRPKRFSRLSGAELELAEYMDAQCNEDDESIEAYAEQWTSDFSLDEAKRWIDALGCYSREEANVISGAGLDPDEYGKVSESVHEYIQNGYTKDADEVLMMGLLASMLSEKQREPRPGPRVPEGQGRLPFEERVFEQTPEPEPDPVAFPRNFRPNDDEKLWLTLAKNWIDSGWDDKDYWDEAVTWWANWFTPEEAMVFAQEMSEYASQNGNREGVGIPIAMAIELRDMGISAQDLVDAVRTTPTVINIKSIDSIVKAVEGSRLKNNRRRRSSRRPARSR